MTLGSQVLGDPHQQRQLAREWEDWCKVGVDAPNHLQGGDGCDIEVSLTADVEHDGEDREDTFREGESLGEEPQR